MSEPYENLEIQPVESTELPKRNVFSWKCEKGFFVGFICTVVISILLFVTFWLGLTTIASPLLVWVVVTLLSYIILFAGMKIGGIFAGLAGGMLYQILFFSFVVRTMVVPGMEIHMSVMLFRILHDVILDIQAWMQFPLRILLMGAALRFAGQRGWFDGKNFVVHICSAVIVIIIVNFGFDSIIWGVSVGGANYIPSIVQSVGGIIGYWAGKRILERIEARFGLQNEL